MMEETQQQRVEEKMSDQMIEHTIKQHVKDAIESITRNLGEKINLFTKYNKPVNIIDDKDCEVICAIAHNTMCTGTAGSGWDNDDGGECKHALHAQARKCERCERKSTFFLEKCPNCPIDTLSPNPRDSRWSISTTAHLKHINDLKEYRLMLTEPIDDAHTCRQFHMRLWTVAKDSEHLTKYIEGQEKYGRKKSINFQPLKEDFYVSKPVLKFSGILTVSDTRTEFTYESFNMGNTEAERIPEEFRGKTSDEMISGKNFGKPRGEVKRRGIGDPQCPEPEPEDELELDGESDGE